jgi:tetratricopeptide (TPR) repeat protein
MSFNTNAPAVKQQTTESTAAAIKYLRQGWNAQAFLLLSEQESERDPAARFALGICHLRIDDLSSAITCFEQALNLLRAATPVPPAATIARGPAENSVTYIRLTAKQVEEEIFLTPMDADFCIRFPKAAEQITLLALIHTYQQKGMLEQAMRLSAGLIGPAFEEYKKKLAGNRNTM